MCEVYKVITIICFSGKLVHDFAPVDMNGRSLRNVSYIAARRDNQVVLIDGDHQKVVVNDFDGRCKGN